MRLAPKKTAQTIIDSGNDFLGALKGNQSGLLSAVQDHFQAQQTIVQLDKGHGRIDFPGLRTLIRIVSERQVYRALIMECSTETRYYVSSIIEPIQALAGRIRGYWGVENKVHYVRDVTQGEDASRIRTSPLIQIWAIARNLALNLYRDYGFENMAQAQRLAGFNLKVLKALFRMK
jgi:predicted transposase YbfD/YdcC